MFKISIDKNLFEDILLKKDKILKKDASKYWKKELIEPIIKDDKISYTIKQVDKLILTNGLGEDKPSIAIECKRVDYSAKSNQFIFDLGKIYEQKNIEIEDDYKDTLIEQLLKEKAILEESINKDALTKTYNIKKMQEDLSKFQEQENSYLLNAVLINIDKFKNINDTFGYEYADKVLEYLGTKLLNYATILNGEVYRYDSKEFLILCFCKKEFLLENLKSLQAEIKFQRVFHPNRPIDVTVSMGVSFFDNCIDKNRFIQKAKESVLLAKNNGRDRIEFIR